MSKATLKRLEALEKRQNVAEKSPAWAVVIVDADGDPLAPVADGVTLRIEIPDNGRGDATLSKRIKSTIDGRSLA